jgi:hypothetical protein
MILAEIISVWKERFNLLRAVFHVNASVRGDVPRQGERMMTFSKAQNRRADIADMLQVAVDVVPGGVLLAARQWI